MHGFEENYKIGSCKEYSFSRKNQKVHMKLNNLPIKSKYQYLRVFYVVFPFVL